VSSELAKQRLEKYLSTKSKNELKHLLVDLESEKERWVHDAKVYLIGSDEFEYIKALIDRIAEVHYQIEQVKKAIEKL